MAFPISNVNVLVDTWESLVIRHNAMARIITNDAITANVSIASTGNSTVSKIAQLYGTFGANTIVATTGLRGGNVSSNGTLTITSNVDVYVAAAATSLLRVGNSTSISTVNSVGASFSNGTANATISTETVSVKNASGNTTVNASAIALVNSTSNVSITSVGLTAGNVVANQTVISIGANVVANTTTILVGNSSVNTTSNNSTVSIANSTKSTVISITGISTNGTLLVTGAATLSNTIAVTGAATLSNTVGITGAATMSNTLAVTGATTLSNTLNVTGVANIASNTNVYLTSGPAPDLTVGNSTSISVITSLGASFSNNATNTSISNETILIRSSATVNAISNSSGLYVSNSTVSASLTRLGLTAGIVVANQSQVSVGANVTANTTTILVGNSSINAVINSSSVAVVGSLSGITLALSGNATISGAANVTGNVNSTGMLTVTGNVVSNGNLVLKTDLVVDVSANADIGAGTGSNILIYRFDKTVFSTGEFTVQVKKGSNTQISKIMLAQNNTSAELTVYGTVSSPPSGNSSPLLASFTANLNNANVELFISQTQPNSSVKLAAQLLR